MWKEQALITQKISQILKFTEMSGLMDRITLSVDKHFCSNSAGWLGRINITDLRGITN